MSEINTRNAIRNMFSTFPDGNGNEALTKSELLSGSGNLMIVSGGDTECVPLDAISFKTYVCRDSWDKAPQGSEHYKVRVENENIFYIYFTNEVGTISLSNLMLNTVPIPFNPTSISKGQTTENFIYITHEGNRLKCQWISRAVQEEAIVDFAKFQMTYEETTYDVHIDSLNLGITYNYILEVSPTTINFPASGGSQLLTINSKKETYRNGVLENTEDAGFRYDTVGTGFSMNQRSVVASANTGSQRTGYVNIIHYDTGGKTVRVNFTQAAAAPVTVYNLYCSPSYLNWGSSEVINRDITVTSERVVKQGNDIISREDVPFTFELTGRDMVKFSARTLNAKTIRVSPRGLNTSGNNYEAILVLNQTGTSERYSANLIQLRSN